MDGLPWQSVAVLCLCSLVGVFDGHSGAWVAQFLSSQLLERVHEAICDAHNDESSQQPPRDEDKLSEAFVKKQQMEPNMVRQLLLEQLAEMDVKIQVNIGSPCNQSVNEDFKLFVTSCQQQ
jgi:serine/threonine protein phosphatase PrpC